MKLIKWNYIQYNLISIWARDDIFILFTFNCNIHVGTDMRGTELEADFTSTLQSKSTKRGKLTETTHSIFKIIQY